MRAVIYKRVSTRGQVKDGVSLETQEDRLTSYIKSQGWDLIKVYEDAGISGKTENRDAYNQMINDAQNKLFDCIVVYKLDRLSRTVKDFHVLADKLENLNINIVSVTQNLDTSSPVGRLLRNILVDFASFESEMTLERVMDNKYAVAEKGGWLGGTLPPGYKWSSHDKKTRKIIIDEGKAEIVKSIFDDYLNGMSDKALSRKYTMFKDGVFLRMLQNPIYIGKMAYRKKPVIKGENGKIRKKLKKDEWIIADCEHEPLISEEVFNKVQELRKNRNHVPNPSKTEQIFTGIVYCGKCDNKMYFYRNYQYISTGKKYYKYYKCNSWYKQGCNIKIHEHILENATKQAFLKLANEEFFNELFRASNENNLKDNNLKLEQFEKHLKKNQVKIKNLVNKLANDDSKSISKIIINEIENLESENKDIQNTINSIKDKLVAVSNIKINFEIVRNTNTIWDSLTVNQKEQLLKTFVKHIFVFDKYVKFIFNANFYVFLDIDI